MSTNSEQEALPQCGSLYRERKLDVWTLFNNAVRDAGAVNLGQGFMDFPPAKFITKAVSDACLDETIHQYSPPRGRPALLAALKARYDVLLGRNLDQDKEIMVASGANEGFLSAFAGFIEKGDEVILLEPAFDQYSPNIEMLGGVPVYVPLRPPVDAAKDGVISSDEWKLDFAELERAASPRSKIIVVNTPLNPVGKVFSVAELTAIGQFAERHNLLVISDEVYENLHYERDHVSISTLPNMWRRTVVVGSAGKLFGITGWRIGWLIGPERLISPALAAHTRIVFTSNSMVQEALATIIAQTLHGSFLASQRDEYLQRRTKLTAAFASVGLPYTCPEGAYYLLVNAAKVVIPADFHIPDEYASRGKSFRLTYFFTTKIGVSGIPPTEFFSEPHKHLAEDYIRFSFCKSDAVLEEARKRLQKLATYVS